VRTTTYFYRARQYDPERGRFLQRDPAGYADGLNLYEYARGAPASLVDPLGLEATEFEKAKQEVADAEAAIAKAKAEVDAAEKQVAADKATVAALKAALAIAKAAYDLYLGTMKYGAPPKDPVAYERWCKDGEDRGKEVADLEAALRAAEEALRKSFERRGAAQRALSAAEARLRTAKDRLKVLGNDGKSGGEEPPDRWAWLRGQLESAYEPAHRAEVVVGKGMSYVAGGLSEGIMFIFGVPLYSDYEMGDIMKGVGKAWEDYEEGHK
jgi:hypothetical protein